MRIFKNGGKFVEKISELPNLKNAIKLFADFETTSGDAKLDSLNPWHNCDVAGLGVTADEIPDVWYIPVGHHTGLNLPREPVARWWQDIIATADSWVNHNVKYDAHVSANCLGAAPTCELIDTIALAKIVDSDRILRGGYSLKALSKSMLKDDISEYEEALMPYLYRNKDYGAIPSDICGEYGCQDVITVRRLYNFLLSQIPEECFGIRETEIALTKILFDIEREGLNVDPQHLATVEFKILNRMMEIDAELADIVGRSFRPHVNGDCYEVLCVQYGLPVLGLTEKGNPSFDKKAMAQYSHHPYAPEGVVSKIVEYRTLDTLKNFFVVPYQNLHINGTLHSSYNQMVRTGRMSCKQPNSQQLSAAAKKLIKPPKGKAFISVDASQIEFRIIVHYIQDEAATAAYRADPDTDFHSWVAEMVKMARKPAKTVNFMMAYGGGQQKCVDMLAANMEVVGQLKGAVDKLIADGKIKEEDSISTFNMLCDARAKKVYQKYHATLPGLKATTRRASNAVRRKGHIFNEYGRRRHLPSVAAHHAFSTLCQGCAADLVKERMVALSEMLEGTPIKMVAQVHDEILMTAPIDMAEDPRTLRDIIDLLERPSFEFRVPTRWDGGVSRVNWLIASKIEEKFPYRSPDVTRLDHCRE